MGASIQPTARTPLPARVYRQLALGGFQSGAELARQLGVSRTAIWKSVVSLRGLGVSVHAVRNRGYRLPLLCEPLDAAKIRASMPEETRARLRRLDTLWALPSTNAALLERTDLPLGHSDVLTAEHQSAGRGRRGRVWLAPPGGAICLSLSWNFAQLPRDLGALGLAVGVCALRALRACGAQGVRLKWPNDLVLEQGKLGGILIEMRAESGGPAYVVIGVGINVALAAALRSQIAATGTQAADLAAAGVEPGPRNALIAALVRDIISGLLVFELEGLKPFAEEWQRSDALRGRSISVLGAEQSTRGIARGIDGNGALVLETADGLKRLISGEVSVRPDR
ncbi:MAG TPA: biotin--[acetyl-CoA-carboxylase] ligase [Steroidobacteraceae bacterium]|nr:biotin--[acetyl-CoA-carboxylase] ligase [Steroidobacteraceae bacterium]